MIERWYKSITYQHLYLHEIDDGLALAEHVAGYERIYNDERPHGMIGWARARATGCSRLRARARYIQTPSSATERMPHAVSGPIPPTSLTRDSRLEGLDPKVRPLSHRKLPILRPTAILAAH